MDTNKILLILFLTLIVGFFVYTKPKKTDISNFRDSVSDNVQYNKKSFDLKNLDFPNNN